MIVNAANSHLAHGGGVAYALNEASKGELQEHSRQYIICHGIVPTGGACVTKGGGSLQCKYVVHAVGPQASRDLSDGDAAEYISSAISTSLMEAQKLGTVSIAFPAISTGIFGIRCEVSAEAILDAILRYNYPQDRNILKDIRIVIIDQKTHICFARMVAQKRYEMGEGGIAMSKIAPISLSTAPGPSFAPTAGAVAGDHQSDARSVTSKSVQLANEGATYLAAPQTTGWYFNFVSCCCDDYHISAKFVHCNFYTINLLTNCLIKI